MHKVKLLALAVALSLGAAGAPAAEQIKIGCASPLTGTQAHLGKDIENGIRLAVDEVNATGPTLGGKAVTFEVVCEDDQADPKTATVVAQKLVDSGVKGVLGHLNSGASIPASRIYHDAGIAQISPASTNVTYTHQGFNTTFRLMANDAQQGKVLGEYAASIGKRVAVIDDRTAYGQGLIDEVEKAVRAKGAEIVAREFTTDKATDFMAILTSIKGKRPDVVVFGGMDPQAAPMVRQMRTLGIKAVFIGGDGMQTAQFIKLAGAMGEGTLGSSPGVPVAQMPGGAAFEEKFAAKYGRIQVYAPFAYDSARVLIKAMQEADSAEPAVYLPKLAAIKLDGVIGPISFDANGDLNDGPVTLYKVQGGEWVPVEVVGGAK